jgi:hypothetical protein
MGSPPHPPCPMGIAEDDTSNDSNNYDNFGNLKKKRALTMTKKKKSKTMTKTITTTTATKKKGGKRCNNKSRHIKEATINHDSQLSFEGVVEGDLVGDVVGNVDGKDNNFAEGHYEKTKKHNWVMHADGRTSRAVEPIPFFGQKSDFRPKVTTEELAGMYDGNGDLRFHCIFEWMLPKFGNADDVSFYEYMAARMWNYMLHIISTTHWKPKYFC